jgi:phosphohistidine phosphatase SixA
MRALQKGGYTIVLRHARTDRSFQEDVGSIPPTRALQRNLNDDGVRDARLMGRVLKKYGVPIGEVLSSPMFRATETAEYVVGVPVTHLELRTFPSPKEALALIAAAPKTGTNRLIVTHHFVLETHIPGITPGAIGESEAAIVRPSASGGVELVGRVLLADWQQLGAALDANPQAAGGHGAPPQGGHGAPSPAGPPALPLAELPATPLVTLARNYVEVFNSGAPERMRTFMELSFVPNPDRPMADRIASYEQLFARLGTITLLGADAVGEAEVTLVGRGKPGGLRLVARRSEGDPSRLASVSFRFEAVR